MHILLVLSSTSYALRSPFADFATKLAPLSDQVASLQIQERLRRQKEAARRKERAAAMRLQAAARGLLLRRRLREMHTEGLHQVTAAASASSAAAPAIHANLGMGVRRRRRPPAPPASSAPACLPRRQPLPRQCAARRRCRPPRARIHGRSPRGRLRDPPHRQPPRGHLRGPPTGGARRRRRGRPPKGRLRLPPASSSALPASVAQLRWAKWCTVIWLAPVSWGCCAQEEPAYVSIVTGQFPWDPGGCTHAASSCGWCLQSRSQEIKSSSLSD